MSRDRAFLALQWLASPWPLNLTVAAIAVAWACIAGNPLEGQELQWFDRALKWRSDWGLAKPVDRRIVHLDITQADLERLPTAADEYRAAAKIIEQASTLGAELVTFDILYNRGTPEMAAPILEAIKGSRATVVLAESFHTASDSRKEGGRVTSFPHLSARHAPAGLINVGADQDGIYRRYSYVQSGPKGPEPSLALASYLALTGISWPKEVEFSNSGAVKWNELSSDGARLVSRELSFSGSPKHLLDTRTGWDGTGEAAFGHLTVKQLDSLHAKATQRENKRPLAGKILFVSYVAAGVSDFGSTSFGAHQPLVLLHSTALNDLFQKTGHRRLPRAMDAATLLLVLVMGVSATCARTKKALTFFWLLGSGIILAAGVAMIFQTNWLPPTIGVTVLWSLAFIAELFRRHSAELIAKLKLRMTMGYYFSPRVLKRVLDNPGCMEPQQVEITVLLTDLRNFTPLSEKLGTRGIFALLNKLFAAQIKAVMAEDGTLEHFIGDQFMCYWGAPDAQPDRTDRALRGALNLMKAMEALRATLDSEVRKLYGYGVGIHSGTAMIGNIGSLDRMDYGVMGDLINSTARIESLTKFYGIPFVITRETFNGLSNPPLHRLVDSVLPVGKASPLELLEIKHPYASSFFEQIAPEYKIAFDLYRNGNFPAAQKRFKEIFLSYEDVPSHQMAARCELLEKNPPKEWRGVYQFRTK